MSFGSEYRQSKHEEKSATIVALTVGGVGSAVVAGCLAFGVMLYDKITERPGYNGLDGTERTAAARRSGDPQKSYERCMAVVSFGNGFEQNYMRMLGFGSSAQAHDLTLGEDRRRQCQRLLQRTGAPD